MTSAKKGPYQTKKEQGKVPMWFSEPCRRFCDAAKRSDHGGMARARRDHDEVLRREGVLR